MGMIVLKSCDVANGKELFSVASEGKIRNSKYKFKENIFMLAIGEKNPVLTAAATVVQTTTMRDGRLASRGV